MIATAGSATALLNLLAAWKASGQKEKIQAAVVATSRGLNDSLVALESSVSALAGGIETRFVESHAQTRQVLDMYRDLVNQLLLDRRQQ